STPPSLASVKSPETPARPKTAPSATFPTDPKLLKKLNELVSGFPEFISEVSVDDYFNHVLPPLPSHLENKVGEVCNILNRNGTYNTTTHRWTLFPQDPATQPSHETQDFLPLADVFNAIVQAAEQLEPGLEPNFKLVVDSLATPMSERGGDMRPDGYFKITDRALNEMRKKCEVLMKKEGWKDVPKTKTPEAPHGTTNEPKHSLQPLTKTGENLKRPPPPLVYGITAPQEFKKQGFTENLENILVGVSHSDSPLKTVRFVFGS
ncbi:hypothetical protein GGU10DRAFT_382496, partial [Lentinula aff. detonsa]